MSDLRDYFRAFVSQRLVPAKNGGRVAIYEYIVSGMESRGMVGRGEFNQLKTILDRSENQSFYRAFYDAVQLGKITKETALEYCPVSRKSDLEDLLGE